MVAAFILCHPAGKGLESTHHCFHLSGAYIICIFNISGYCFHHSWSIFPPNTNELICSNNQKAPRSYAWSCQEAFWDPEPPKTYNLYIKWSDSQSVLLCLLKKNANIYIYIFWPFITDLYVSKNSVQSWKTLNVPWYQRFVWGASRGFPSKHKPGLKHKECLCDTKTVKSCLFPCQDTLPQDIWFLKLTWTSGQGKGSSGEMNAQENWSKARSFSIAAHLGIGPGPLTGCHTKASGCKEHLTHIQTLVTKHSTVRLRWSLQPAAQVLKLGLGQRDVRLLIETASKQSQRLLDREAFQISRSAMFAFHLN